MNLNCLMQLGRNYLLGASVSDLTQRDIIGLHLEEEQLHFTCLRWSRHGWRPVRLSSALEPYGSVQEPAPWSLKQFLEWLTVFPLLEKETPAGRRSVYLTLPRDHFSVRDLQLPPMSMEDALLSVTNSLPVCSHLPIEKIYYDIHLCRVDEGRINAMIVYAPREDINIYLDIFRETGYMEMLRGIFPVSFGMGAWLNLQHYSMPMGIVSAQGNVSELAVYQKGGWLFSGIWQESEGTTEKDLLFAGTKSKFPGLDERLYYLDQTGTPQLPSPKVNHLNPFPLLLENQSIAAVAPLISGQQAISVDGRPPRLKRFKSSRLAIPLILFLLLLICVMTVKVNYDISRSKKEIAAFKTEINVLRDELKPLEVAHHVRRQVRRFIDDTHAFVDSKPRMFTHLNQVARLLPEATWFSHFSYSEGMMIFRGESPDSLKVIDALRSSGIFDQVNFKGAVNRDKSGSETFSLAVKMKENEADK